MERDDWEEIRRTSQQQEAEQKIRYDQCAFYRICAALCAVGFGIAGYHLAFWLYMPLRPWPRRHSWGWSNGTTAS